MGPATSNQWTTRSSQCYQEQNNPVSYTGSSAVLFRKLTPPPEGPSSRGADEETGEVPPQHLPLELDLLGGNCG